MCMGVSTDPESMSDDPALAQRPAIPYSTHLRDAIPIRQALISPMLSLIGNRVPNGPSKTGLDQLVWSKVKSSLMVEIRPTGWSGLADQTYPGLVRPGPPSDKICTTL